MGRVFRKAFRILGLGERKGRWVMEQDFYGDLQFNLAWFFAVFSGVLACEQALLFGQVKRVSRVSRERAAKPRGAGERRACNHPLQIFICTSPRRREIPLAEK